MIDRHHIAHYAIAATLLAGGVSGYQSLSSKPHAWPALTSADATALTAALPHASGEAITVYCINYNCEDIEEDVAKALRAAGATVTTETPFKAANGLEVGSSDPVDAADLQAALMAASLK